MQLLDDLDQRQLRLEQERLDLQSSEQRLGSADRLAARWPRRSGGRRSLAVLAGTVPASVPASRDDLRPDGDSIEAPVLLNAVQELRDAGADAMSGRTTSGWSPARGSPRRRGPAPSWCPGSDVAPPYVFRVLGDPATLSTAMQIPGGASDTVRTDGGRIAIADRATVTVSAVLPLQVPKYAQPGAQPLLMDPPLRCRCRRGISTLGPSRFARDPEAAGT